MQARRTVAGPSLSPLDHVDPSPASLGGSALGLSPLGLSQSPLAALAAQAMQGNAFVGTSLGKAGEEEPTRRESKLPFMSELEASFGEDLSDIPVRFGHAGALRSMGAQAATVGDEVVLPNRSQRKEVVAHEVAHALQHRRHGAGSAAGGPLTSAPHDSSEREADAAGRRAAQGQPAAVRARPTGHISRFGLPGFVSDGWNKAKDVASSAWEGTKSAASSAWEGTKSVASSAWEGTKSAASSAWEGAKELGANVAEGYSNVKDYVHTGLDIAGMIPVVGELADGLNAGLYLAEGDYANAALSGAAMIPGIGSAATATRLGTKAVKAGSKVVKKVAVEGGEQLLKRGSKELVQGGANKLAREGTEKVTKEAASTATSQTAKKVDDLTGLPGGNKPPSYETPFKQLSGKKHKELMQKVDNRTATPDEWKRLQWNRRFKNRRERGVRSFYRQEAKKIREGGPLTRNWSPSQKKAILSGKRPKYQGKTMQGHHRYSASKYPQLSDKADNIYPVTHREHLNRWHGGDYNKASEGLPKNLDFPEQF